MKLYSDEMEKLGDKFALVQALQNKANSRKHKQSQVQSKCSDQDGQDMNKEGATNMDNDGEQNQHGANNG